MKNILKLEELAMFVLSIYLFSGLNTSLLFYFIFLLAPDASMIGYLINPKTGAFTYNLVHHKATSIILFIIGSVT